MTEIVVGSGPSGAAAVMALLARGREVTVVDVGGRLEPEAEARRLALAGRVPSAWGADEVLAFKAPQLAAGEAILRYGSGFAVAPADAVLADDGGTALRASHALGGFGNVWGASVLPWRPADLAGWPRAAAALGPHYAAVAEFLPVAGTPAGYDTMLGAPEMAFAPPMPETAQGARLIERLDRAAARLAAQGVVAGPARQAVAGGCRMCGLCLYGCPWGLIFTPGPLIDELVRKGRIGYRAGRVARLEETGGGVRLHLADGGVVEGARAFVAAGVLETARIFFASDPALAERELRLVESRHAFTPFLSSWTARGTGREPHHTLVQAFAEMDAPEVSPALVHTQFYGWNDFYARELSEKYGRGIGALEPLFAALARRLLVAQTFLHSDHCPEIALRPAPDGRLVARVVDKPGFVATVARARRHLARALRAAGLHAVTPAGRTGPPGSSFHLGGSLPMREAPGPGETDTLGRPAGWERVHAVDASVVPTVPASTITFSVMANAHRIATHA